MNAKIRHMLAMLALVVLSALVFLAARYLAAKRHSGKAIDWDAARARNEAALAVRTSIPLPAPVEELPAEKPAPARPKARLLFDPYVTHLIALRDRLGLTQEQIAAVGTLLAELRENREQYERQIAKAQPLAGGKVLIEIPAYPETGAAMLAQFKDAMAAELGADLAKKVYGTFVTLSADNRYFGKYPQRYEVSALPDGFLSIERELAAPPGQPAFRAWGTDVMPKDDLGPYRHLADLFPQ